METAKKLQFGKLLSAAKQKAQPNASAAKPKSLPVATSNSFNTTKDVSAKPMKITELAAMKSKKLSGEKMQAQESNDSFKSKLRADVDSEGNILRTYKADKAEEVTHVPEGNKAKERKLKIGQKLGY